MADNHDAISLKTIYSPSTKDLVHGQTLILI